MNIDTQKLIQEAYEKSVGIQSLKEIAPNYKGNFGKKEEPTDIEDIERDSDDPTSEEEAWADKEAKLDEFLYQMAGVAGLTQADLQKTASAYNIKHPAKACDLAFANAGNGFPKRGMWSGETVWLFLTLRDRGVIDANGNPI